MATKKDSAAAAATVTVDRSGAEGRIDPDNLRAAHDVAFEIGDMAAMLIAVANGPLPDLTPYQARTFGVRLQQLANIMTGLLVGDDLDEMRGELYGLPNEA